MYLFGCSYRRLTSEQIDLRERIAHRHGAEFHYAGFAVVGVDDVDPTSWFSCPGDPFDSAVAASVRADLGLNALWHKALEEGTS